MKSLLLIGITFALSSYAITTEIYIMSNEEFTFGAEQSGENANDDLIFASSTLACASGGPVSEAFYESMYLRCLNSVCPSKCGVGGGNAKGDFYTNGHYVIVCNCY